MAPVSIQYCVFICVENILVHNYMCDVQCLCIILLQNRHKAEIMTFDLYVMLNLVLQRFKNKLKNRLFTAYFL